MILIDFLGQTSSIVFPFIIHRQLANNENKVLSLLYLKCMQWRCSNVFGLWKATAFMTVAVIYVVILQFAKNVKCHEN